MTYHVDKAIQGSLSDAELQALMIHVFVETGSIDPDIGAQVFHPERVRELGDIFYVRSPANGQLLGMLLIVGPSSAARRLATVGEAELHLLLTDPNNEHPGVGQALLHMAIARSREQGFARLLTWAEPLKLPAHDLYRDTGFIRHPERDFRSGDREYFVFQCAT